jgi:hypothetical protein
VTIRAPVTRSWMWTVAGLPRSTCPGAGDRMVIVAPVEGRTLAIFTPSWAGTTNDSSSTVTAKAATTQLATGRPDRRTCRSRNAAPASPRPPRRKSISTRFC